MTTIISTTHYANYSEDGTNVTTQTGNDTSEVNYPTPKINSTTITLLGVNGNMNTVFSPKYDAKYAKINESKESRMTGDESLKNKYQINNIRRMKKPALLEISGISR